MDRADNQTARRLLASVAGMLLFVVASAPMVSAQQQSNGAMCPADRGAIGSCAPLTIPTPEPDGVLAYVDETDDSVSTPPIGLANGDGLPLVPIAATGIAVLTVGGLARRRSRPEEEEVPDTEVDLDRRLTEIASLMRAAKPSKKARIISLLDKTRWGLEANAPAAHRQIELARRGDESELSKLVESVSAQSDETLLSREAFAFAANTEWTRQSNGGADGAIASLVLSELDAVQLRLGNKAAQSLFDEVAHVIADLARPLDVLGRAHDYELAILMPEVDEAGARDYLDQITKKITSSTFAVSGERVLLTPASGFAMLSDTDTAPELIRAVQTARSLSMMNLHLDAERWDADVAMHAAPKVGVQAWTAFKQKLRTPLQIALTVVIAWVLPFLTYLGLDAIGLDISFWIYVIVVTTLVMTGVLILA